MPVIMCESILLIQLILKKPKKTSNYCASKLKMKLLELSQFHLMRLAKKGLSVHW
uniref:MTBC n=1 Tax=Arundo donax TaxID=35708 RepID=A0A0A9FX91_ARUDO